MATGGLGSSFLRASDMEYDHTCTPCDDDGLNVEAKFYCRQCMKRYCDNCQKHHNKILKEHTVLGQDEVDDWGTVKNEDILEMCSEHVDKKVEMYCVDDDTVCCTVCISLHHRACKHVQHIAEAAKGIHKNTEFKNQSRAMTKVISELQEAVNAKTNNRDTLQDDRRQFISTVEEQTDQLMAGVVAIKEDTIEEFDRLHAERDAMLTSEIKNRRRLLQDIQKFQADMSNPDTKDEKKAFTAFKKCPEKITKATELQIPPNTREYEVEYSEDPHLGQFLSQQHLLGQFRVFPDPLDTKPSKADSNSQQQRRDANSTSQSQSKTGTASDTGHDGQVPGGKLGRGIQVRQSPVRQTERVFQVKSHQKYNMRLTGEYTCDIYGICQLPSGRLVVTDASNKKVKLLDDCFTVIARFDLPFEPYNICHIQGNEVAVTATVSEEFRNFEDIVQFIEIKKDNILLTRKLKFKHVCRNIQYKNAVLYVSSGRCLYMYSVGSGEIGELYKGDDVCKFTVNDDGSRIYITDYDILTTIDNHGNTLATFKDPELKDCYEVCIGDQGSVFVCFHLPSTIIQVSACGRRKLATVATQEHGVKRPVSLYFNTTTSQLIVGQYDSSDILVLSLK